MLPTGMGGTLAARIAWLAPEVDPSTGGLLARIAFDTPVALPPGLSVTANIVVEESADALTVPRSALIGGATGRTVFIDIGGFAARRAVTVKSGRPIGCASLMDWPPETG
ncbi:MAG: hypothetical protein IPL47_14325 [Phyllobacteriaceae bacterium]|nr:hypothetical protein [Phyllobacteriaceae bacterium]